MNENYLKRLINKHTRARVWTFLILISIVVIIFICNFKMLSTLYTPLSPIKSAADASALFKNDKVYAQLENGDMYFIDYGIYTYTTTYGVKTSDEKLSQVFGVVAYKDGYLLTLVPKSYTSLNDTALQSVSAICKVEALKDDENYNTAYKELVKEIASSTNETPEEVEKYIPKLCVTVQEGGRTFDQVFIAIDMLAFMVLLIFMILNLTVLLDYKKSKFYQSLDALGNAEDAEYKINQSVASGKYLLATLNGLISYEYMIGKNGSSLKIYPVRDLIWVHLKVLKQKVNFITVSKSFQVMFYIKGVKKPVSILFRKKEQANETIQKIAETFPVICGYSKELANTYKSNYADFLQIAENYSNEYNRRKRQAEEQQNAEQTDPV